MKRQAPNTFDLVKRIGLTLPGVEAATRYDGSPVLKLAGVFMAGLATHSSAEPNTLVVRADLEERESFIEDAPETYYLTEYYRPYPLVLVRLERGHSSGSTRTTLVVTPPDPAEDSTAAAPAALGPDGTVPFFQYPSRRRSVISGT